MTKQIADILLADGYGNRYGGAPDVIGMIRVDSVWENIDPFAKTKEGYEQAHTLIEHFRVEHNELWVKSKSGGLRSLNSELLGLTWWQHALARLRYCLDNVND